ncbi:hypothetical protein HMPREF0682_1825 [Propionibacterium acidifaciens F0233]|uniref:Uncharacterized protein n=1 Tax=Propionibacterium acidifaciens F0233 TaxID=553198 RepID=U2RV88_9ACTN|nr:hypothetical protein HMPREF0682_1825 [Propionibacterium acidifaciens F0233]
MRLCGGHHRPEQVLAHEVNDSAGRGQTADHGAKRVGAIEEPVRPGREQALTVRRTPAGPCGHCGPDRSRVSSGHLSARKWGRSSPTSQRGRGVPADRDRRPSEHRGGKGRDVLPR